MKAITLLSNGVLKWADVAMPECSPTECIISVRSVGICSSDIARAYENGAYHYPLIMGHEISGVVVSVGQMVTQFSVGQRVAVFPLRPCNACDACRMKQYARCNDYDYYGSRCNGGYAEYLSVDAWNLIPMPSNVCLDDAALIEPMAVVIHALRQAGIFRKNLLEKQRVVVIGVGFLGLLLLRILRATNSNTHAIGIDRNQFKLDIATKYADELLIAKSQNQWDYALKTFGSTADIVIEATGAPMCIQHAVTLSKSGSKIILMGNMTGNVMLDKITVSQILRKELKIVGTWNSIYKGDDCDDWNEALSLIINGVKPSEFVTNFTDLDGGVNLLNKMHNHKAQKENFEYIKGMIKNA